MNPVKSFFVVACILAAAVVGCLVDPYLALAFLAAVALIAAALKMANVWQKFVVLRMRKLQGVKGAGMCVIITVIDSTVAVIDCRIQSPFPIPSIDSLRGGRPCDHAALVPPTSALLRLRMRVARMSVRFRSVRAGRNDFAFIYKAS